MSVRLRVVPANLLYVACAQRIAEHDTADSLEPVSVDLPAVKTQTSSPKALGKRTREMATPVSARPSPSKLRGAFERSKLAQKN